MRFLLWIPVLAGALLGLLQIFETHATADSAPQQAAGFCMALAYAVVPYVLVRAIEKMMEPKELLVRVVGGSLDEQPASTLRPASPALSAADPA